LENAYFVIATREGETKKKKHETKKK